MSRRSARLKAREFPFMKLPAELRLQIYEAAFEEYFRGKANVSHDYTPALKFTTPYGFPIKGKKSFFAWFHLNRVIRSEAMTHVFGNYMIEVPLRKLFAVIRLFGPMERAKIKHLRIQGFIDKAFVNSRDARKFLKGLEPASYALRRGRQIEVGLNGLKDLIEGPFPCVNLCTLHIAPDMWYFGYMMAQHGKEARFQMDAIKMIEKLRGLKEFAVNIDPEDFDIHKRVFHSLDDQFFKDMQAAVVQKVTQPMVAMNEEDGQEATK